MNKNVLNHWTLRVLSAFCVFAVLGAIWYFFREPPDETITDPVSLAPICDRISFEKNLDYRQCLAFLSSQQAACDEKLSAGGFVPEDARRCLLDAVRRYENH